MNSAQNEIRYLPPHSSSGIARWALSGLVALFLVAVPVHGASGEAGGSDLSLFIVSFLFLMGVSQAGVVFCAITRMVRAQWSKPYHRLAELSTMAFFPFAILGFLLIYYQASDDLFYWLSASADDHLSPWLNLDWLLIRNVSALLLFYGVSYVYVMKALRPDLEGADGVDHREVEQQLYVMSPVVVLCFVLVSTFFAWDYAMMIIPHWHSTVFPIFFWFGNLFAGTAALIVFPALLGRSAPTGSNFGPAQIRGLSMMVTAFTLIWLYMFWAQFFVIWFGNLPHEFEPLWRQMYGHYAPFYWTMMAGCFFIPFVALIFAVINRSLVAMCVVSFGVNLGIWICKYLMVVPALSPDAGVFNNALDVGLTLGLLAGFVIVVVVLAKRAPMYSRWELALAPLPKRR